MSDYFFFQICIIWLLKVCETFHPGGQIFIMRATRRRHAPSTLSPRRCRAPRLAEPARTAPRIYRRPKRSCAASGSPSAVERRPLRLSARSPGRSDVMTWSRPPAPCSVLERETGGRISLSISSGNTCRARLPRGVQEAQPRVTSIFRKPRNLAPDGRAFGLFRSAARARRRNSSHHLAVRGSQPAWCRVRELLARSRPPRSRRADDGGCRAH